STSFFFQAEDGIRDLTVTGVQTCALPIYRPSLSRCRGEASLRTSFSRGFDADVISSATRPRLRGTERPRAPRGPARERSARNRRSEERRVGKEGGPRSGALVYTEVAYGSR